VSPAANERPRKFREAMVAELSAAIERDQGDLTGHGSVKFRPQPKIRYSWLSIRRFDDSGVGS
jgi:hypothetical protein